MSITESWLTADHLDEEVDIEGYTLHRGDRSRPKSKKGGRASGGVAMYVANTTAAEPWFKFKSNVIECIGLTFEGLNTVCYTVYRTPDSANHRSRSKEFKELIKALDEHMSALSTPTPTIILQGDFNLPHADWDSGEAQKTTSDPDEEEKKKISEEKKMIRDLHELALSHFLVQLVDEPTHVAGNTLDLIFRNDASDVHSMECTPCSGFSDHFIVTTNISQHNTTNQDETEPLHEPTEADEWHTLNFFSDAIEWEKVSTAMAAHDWALELGSLNAEDSLKAFTSACLNICQRLIPTRRKANNSNSKIPHSRRRLMRQRTRLRKRYNACKSAVSKARLSEQLAGIERQLRESYTSQSTFEENKAVESIKTNPKYFYSYAKKFSKTRTNIGPLKTPEKTLTTSPSKMAEILSRQYESAFSTPRFQDDDPSKIFMEPNKDSPKLHDIPFTDAELAAAMRELRLNSAAGPDGIPAVLLNKCAAALAPPLAEIWRKSLHEGEVPSLLKSALIVPIHKGKSKAQAKNYRPVALTSQLCKVFEKVVRKWMVDFMEQHSLFNPNQHGFRAGRSCLSQLLSHFDTITMLLEQGLGVDVIYLDFAKAFDKVDIGITLRKLQRMGIGGNLGRWLFSFLNGRTQTVVVDGSRSQPGPVLSGVPQGSVLGPLLFLVLLGDIDEQVVHSFVSSFADDTRVGKSIGSTDDARLLQEDLDKIFEWSKRVNMTFNSDKFEHLRYQANIQHPLHTYLSDSGTPIETKSKLRDLGVTISASATFSDFISEKITSVTKLSGWALRTFKSRSLPVMLTIWKSLLRCHIDYCSQLWSPHKTGDIQAVERLQHSFIRKIAGLQGLTYWEQLKVTKLTSLERRRERYAAIYTWRILENQVPNLSSSPVTCRANDRRGRICSVPNISPRAPVSVQTIRRNSFAVRGPNLFNSLPRHVRDLSGCKVDTFKNALDRYLASVPDQPLIPGMTQYRQIESNSIIDWAAHLMLVRDELPRVDSPN